MWKQENTTDAVQTVIRFAWRAPRFSDPSRPALELLNTILGGGFTSRLNQNLRETHGYTYGAVSRFDTLRSPGSFFATAGVHPHAAAGAQPGDLQRVEELLPHPRVVALGETGLDYHYDHSPRPRQRQVFERQLSLAAELRLPAVIHAREADQDVAAVLRDHPDCRVVLHSFSSGPGLLEAALDLGHFVSFSGMVTFRNWGRVYFNKISHVRYR